MPTDPVELAKRRIDPWRLVVDQIRTSANAQRWRASPPVLAALPLWPEFAIAWMDLASDIPTIARPGDCPKHAETIEQRKEWVWAEVWPFVDLTFRAIADRIEEPDHLVLRTMRRMIEGSLIFPDGTIHERLLGKLDAVNRIDEAVDAKKVQEAALKAAVAQSQFAEIMNAKSKSPAP